MAFLEFIKFWIKNHEGTVKTFSLRLSMPRNVGEIIDRCIAFATQREVKELELDFADVNHNENVIYFDNYEVLFELPKQVYKHSSLVSLKLYSCSFVENEMLNFQVLKEVSLGWMEVRLIAIKALLTSCKMLESLSFKKCWNSDKFNLGEEENVWLRKLVLDKCRFEFDFFKVNAPNLKVFKYCGLMNFFIIEIHSPVMEEVDLDFSLEYEFEGHGDPLCNLVKDLCTASVLTVCSFVLQVIPSGPEQLCDMHVRHLIMKTALHEDEFLGITFFLNTCHMLERLTIELCSEKNDLFDYEPPFYFNRTQFWIDNVEDYECLRSSLEVVEINGFRGTGNERLVLRYFIICGVVLKKISINMLKDDSSRTVEFHCREWAEILLTVPMASRNLEISIC
ncbi:putative F-box protein [Spatholobus suberectus]|nr:putative F-box protein [Spatholobus suberectus]